MIHEFHEAWLEFFEVHSKTSFIKNIVRRPALR